MRDAKKTRKLVYDAIVDYMLKNNYPPSVRELCKLTGLTSTSSVHAHLMELAVEGKIKMSKDSEPRTITVPGISYTDKRAYL